MLTMPFSASSPAFCRTAGSLRNASQVVLNPNRAPMKWVATPVSPPPVIKDGRFKAILIPPGEGPLMQDMSRVLETSYKLMQEGAGQMGYIPPGVVDKLVAKAKVPHLVARQKETAYYVVQDDHADRDPAGNVMGVFGVDTKPGHAPIDYGHKKMLRELELHRVQQLSLDPKHRGQKLGGVLQALSKECARQMGLRGVYMLAPIPKGPRLTQFVPVPQLDYFLPPNTPIPTGYPSLQTWNAQWPELPPGLLALKPAPQRLLDEAREKRMAVAKLDRVFVADKGSIPNIEAHLNKWPDPDIVGVRWVHKAYGYFGCRDETELGAELDKRRTLFSGGLSRIQRGSSFQAKELIPPQQFFNPQGKSVAVLCGTFDPPHLGHIEALAKTIANTGAKYGVLCVSLDHPTKTPRYSLEDRLIMLQTIQKKYPYMSVVVTNRGNWRELYPNMDKLVKHGNSDTKVVHVIGSDKIKSCYESRAQAGLVSTIAHHVFVRGTDTASGVSDSIQQFSWSAQDQILIFEEEPLRGVSSTRIRMGEDEGMYKLLGSVMDLCKKYPPEAAQELSSEC